MYALFHNNHQISKAHSTKIAAQIEAQERKVLFGNKWKGYFLLNGWEIRLREETNRVIDKLKGK